MGIQEENVFVQLQLNESYEYRILFFEKRHAVEKVVPVKITDKLHSYFSLILTRLNQVRSFQFQTMQNL